MITRPTVLILGAGASVDYNYPLGETLVTTICEELSNDRSPLFDLLVKCRNSEQHVRNFREGLHSSNFPSVDAFLENRREFEKIGKAAIAGVLIRHEHTDNLIRRGWYKYLHALLLGRKEDFHLNKLVIVTFNYDRSFEASLYIVLKQAYNLTDEDCARYMNSIPIIHVHGQLSELPFCSQDGRSYDPHVDYNVVLKAINGIKIVHEAIGETEEFQFARSAIRESEIVCCLGFGYHPQNVKRLQLSANIQNGKKKEVYFSAMGFTEKQKEKLITRIFPDGLSGNYPFHFGGQNQDTLQFLKDSAALE